MESVSQSGETKTKRRERGREKERKKEKDKKEGCEKCYKDSRRFEKIILRNILLSTGTDNKYLIANINDNGDIRMSF